MVRVEVIAYTPTEFLEEHDISIDRCRELLGLEQPSPTAKKSASQLMLETTGVDLSRCPACRLGTLVILAQLPAIEVSPYFLRGPPLDSS